MLCPESRSKLVAAGGHRDRSGSGAERLAGAAAASSALRRLRSA